VEERRKGEERGAEGRRQRPSKKKKTQQFFMEKKRWAKTKKGETLYSLSRSEISRHTRATQAFKNERERSMPVTTRNTKHPINRPFPSLAILCKKIKNTESGFPFVEEKRKQRG
jgi:hypothetical protein